MNRLTPKEAGALLALAASYDSRTVGKGDVAAWWEQLQEFTFRDCRRAVLDHYGEHRERIWPADIIRRVKEIRARRVPRLDYADFVPDVHPESNDYVRLLQARHEAVLNGASIAEAIAEHPVDPAEEARAVERGRARLALGSAVDPDELAKRGAQTPAERAAAFKSWAANLGRL